MQGEQEEVAIPGKQSEKVRCIDERKKERKGEGFQPLSIKIVETSAEPTSYQNQPIWWRRHPADSAAPPPHNDTLCSRPRAHVNPPPPVRQLSLSLLASSNGLGTSEGSVVNLRSAGDQWKYLLDLH